MYLHKNSECEKYIPDWDETLLRESEKVAPFYFRTYAGLKVRLLLEGRYHGRTEEVQKILKSFLKRSQGGRHKNQELEAHILRLQGIFYEILENFELAAQTQEEVLRIRHNNQSPHEISSYSHVTRTYLKLIHQNTNHPKKEEYVTLVKGLIEQGKAIALEQVRKNSNYYPIAQISHQEALLYYEKGNLKDAATAINSAIEYISHHNHSWEHLRKQYEAFQEKIEEAFQKKVEEEAGSRGYIERLSKSLGLTSIFDHASDNILAKFSTRK